MILGAGRATKESEIDLAVGLVLNKKVGDQVKKANPCVTIHSKTENVGSNGKNLSGLQNVTKK